MFYILIESIMTFESEKQILLPRTCPISCCFLFVYSFLLRHHQVLPNTFMTTMSKKIEKTLILETEKYVKRILIIQN